MKTVLITGGSRGIGKAMVYAFAKNGYNVAFTYNKSENSANELSTKTGAIAIKADQRSQEEVLSAVKKTYDTFGSIDCLVNNASISSFSMFTDLTLEDWNDSINVNLTGAFLYSKAVIPYMIHKKFGRIINISSMWGIVGSSCEVHYSTTKAGLIGMTKALAKELGPSGITVNAIAPGVIDTEMNSSLDEETLRQLSDDTPLSRIGKPEEIANIAVFLASDESSFVTGDVINASGGYII